MSVQAPKSTLRREGTDSVAEAAAVAADEALDEVGAPSTIDITDEASVLKDLTTGVRDQEDIQRDISNQANRALNEQEDERDQKRLAKTILAKEKLEAQRRTLQARLHRALNPVQRKTIQSEVEKLTEEISGLENDVADIQARIESRRSIDGQETEEQHTAGARRMPNESQRDFLIRTGKITPFSRMPIRHGDGEAVGELAELLLDAEEEAEGLGHTIQEDQEPKSHQNLKTPGFADIADAESAHLARNEFSLRPRKKRRLAYRSSVAADDASGTEGEIHTSRNVRGSSEYSQSGDDFIEPEERRDYEDEEDSTETENSTSLKRVRRSNADSDTVELGDLDDGNEDNYQKRLKSWVFRRSRARQSKRHRKADSSHITDNGSNDETGTEEDGEEDEWFKPSPDGPDHHFENGLKLPGDIYNSLFDYQKVGVQWLGELYEQEVGGIIGDEMGLGKTIQIISFLAGLHYSKKLTKPIIIVAPGTVLRQWVNEFHRWWPPLRVSILHPSGSGMLNSRNESRYNNGFDGGKTKNATKSHQAAKKIVDRVVQEGHVLVTTYAGLQTYDSLLIPVSWGYAVLDEGHKIRNPNTAITVYCKELQTPNRVILSGTPMQNNLVELWSLFDFVYPMRLGTLVDFRNQFEIPIKLGGYANATNLQIMTATKCAETLKDAISPYLLQRMKADVAADLPRKSEQVLFCKLTKPQRDAYEVFLNSDDMTSILNRTRQSLYGIDILRKICNHPDLLDPKLRRKAGYNWGNPHKSGKMQVVKALLEIWKNAGDKVLLFSQGVQMLDIIESFIRALGTFKFLRMDGSTAMKDRQVMVDDFNNNPELNIFLLTTKVGGLGVNLTGANRVIIFDPDWNPSTDVQARERAWRLGQTKEVTIYRLMTAGTIEEKIYHRQIFKQFLADKILKDPKQRQTFHMKDLYDLFTLGSAEDSTETGQMFEGTEKKIQSIATPLLSNAESLAPLNTDPLAETQLQIHGETTTNKDREQVQSIVGVSKLEDYRGDEAPDKVTSDESRIMEGLFARSGVHSVLQHDQIVNGKRVIAADQGMLEREAKRVAAEAAAELRKAGEAARHVPIGTVTWTGEVGEAGRPINVRRNGPSSSGILSNLAARQGLNSTNNTREPRNGPAGTGRDTGPRGKDFIKLIRDFIILHGGSVPTQMLVVHFSPMCKTAQQSAEFKAMLKEVAEMSYGSNNRLRGRWTLKPEFAAR